MNRVQYSFCGRYTLQTLSNLYHLTSVLIWVTQNISKSSQFVCEKRCAISTFKAAVDKHFEDVHSFTLLHCVHESLVDLVRLANHDVDKLLRGADWLLSAGLHI